MKPSRNSGSSECENAQLSLRHYYSGEHRSSPWSSDLTGALRTCLIIQADPCVILDLIQPLGLVVYHSRSPHDERHAYRWRWSQCLSFFGCLRSRSIFFAPPKHHAETLTPFLSPSNQNPRQRMTHLSRLRPRFVRWMPWLVRPVLPPDPSS